MDDLYWAVLITVFLVWMVLRTELARLDRGLAGRDYALWFDLLRARENDRMSAKYDIDWADYVAGMREDIGSWHSLKEDERYLEYLERLIDIDADLRSVFNIPEKGRRFIPDSHLVDRS